MTEAAAPGSSLSRSPGGGRGGGRGGFDGDVAGGGRREGRAPPRESSSRGSSSYGGRPPSDGSGRSFRQEGAGRFSGGGGDRDRDRAAASGRGNGRPPARQQFRPAEQRGEASTDDEFRSPPPMFGARGGNGDDGGRRGAGMSRGSSSRGAGAWSRDDARGGGGDFQGGDGRFKYPARPSKQALRADLFGQVVYGVTPVLLALKQQRRKPHVLYVQESLSDTAALDAEGAGSDDDNDDGRDDNSFGGGGGRGGGERAAAAAPNVPRRKVADAVATAVSLAQAAGASVKYATKHDLNQLTDSRPHQGLVLDCSPLEVSKGEEQWLAL